MPKCQVYYSRIDRLKDHKCVYNPAKLKYASDGTVVSRYANMRLKRVDEMSPDRQLVDEKLLDKSSKPNHPNSKNSKKKVMDDSSSMENLEGEVVVKTEVLDTIQTGDEDDQAKVRRQKSPSSKKVRKKSVSIKKIIMTDPAFIMVCKKNPEFRELILGKRAVRGKSRRQRKKQSSDDDDSDDAKLGPINTEDRFPIKVKTEPELLIDDYESDSLNLIEPKVEPEVGYDEGDFMGK